MINVLSSAMVDEILASVGLEHIDDDSHTEEKDI
jgi:hypothetical protein